MTVGAVAARAEMPVDDIEDLRLAIDELCLSAVGDRRDGRLELRYDWGPSGMEVSCTFKPSDPTASSDGTSDNVGALPTDLSERILDALVDEHGRDEVDGGEAHGSRNATKGRTADGRVCGGCPCGTTLRGSRRPATTVCAES